MSSPWTNIKLTSLPPSSCTVIPEDLRRLKWKGFQFSLSLFYIWSPGTGVNFSCIPAFPGPSCIKNKSQTKNKMILLLLDSWLKRIQKPKYIAKIWKPVCPLTPSVPTSPFDSSHNNADLHEWDEKELTLTLHLERPHPYLRTAISMMDSLSGIHGLPQWEMLMNYFSVLHCSLFSLDIISDQTANLLYQ